VGTVFDGFPELEFVLRLTILGKYACGGHTEGGKAQPQAQKPYCAPRSYHHDYPVLAVFRLVWFDNSA
jgi:hypothetical protein